MIDVLCLQEVRCGGQGAMMLGLKGRIYMLWLAGKEDEKKICMVQVI